MAASKRPDTRARNFTCVVYPDSAPPDWLDILSSQLVPAFVSPLHDIDDNPDGKRKKPHYHVVVMFEGKKSDEQVLELFSLINGVTTEFQLHVKSLRGMARYLCHLDNPEKAQYSPDQVKAFCGADYMGTIGLPIDKYKSIGEMMDFVVTEECSSYADLLLYSRTFRPDWFRTLCDNGSYVMKEFIKSYSWKLQNISGENYIPDEV